MVFIFMYGTADAVCVAIPSIKTATYCFYWRPFHSLFGYVDVPTDIDSTDIDYYSSSSRMLLLYKSLDKIQDTSK